MALQLRSIKTSVIRLTNVVSRPCTSYSECANSDRRAGDNRSVLSKEFVGLDLKQPTFVRQSSLNSGLEVLHQNNCDATTEEAAKKRAASGLGDPHWPERGWALSNQRSSSRTSVMPVYKWEHQTIDVEKDFGEQVVPQKNQTGIDEKNYLTLLQTPKDVIIDRVMMAALSGVLKPNLYNADDIFIRNDCKYTEPPDTACEPHYAHTYNNSTNIFNDIISRENFDVTILKEHSNTLLPHSHTSLFMNEVQDDNVVFCTPVVMSAEGNIRGDTEKPRQPEKNPKGPSTDQLQLIKENLSEQLPKLFVEKHDYRIYNKDIIFENNYWGKNQVFKGISAYVMEISKLRMFAHLKFANIKVELLKMTVHEDEGSVKVRWRISGLSQMRALFFWRYRPGKYKKNVSEDSEWHDGFSTFWVGRDGFIYKHRVDKVMPDVEVVSKEPATMGLKVALFTALFPRSSFSDLPGLLMKKSVKKVKIPGEDSAPVL